MSSSKAEMLITIFSGILVSAFGVLVFEKSKISFSEKIVIFLSLALLLLILYKRAWIIEKYKKYRNFDKIDNLKSQIHTQKREMFRYLRIWENGVKEFKESISYLEKNVNTIIEQVGDESIVKHEIFDQIKNIQNTLNRLEKLESFLKEISKDLTDAEEIEILKEPRTKDVINYVNQVNQSNSDKNEQVTHSKYN
ncbi:hypothetical protein NIES4103_56680 [Nostoc sp. NIES-4103]|nr:hypothetical protein NIES4103_56680 [Nostoc sp. NIES-4103]